MTKDRFEKLQDMLDTEFEETLDDLIEVEFNEPILSEEVRALYKKQHPKGLEGRIYYCLLYTSPSPRDRTRSRMPSSA